jgi:hypothetical protein
MEAWQASVSPPCGRDPTKNNLISGGLLMEVVLGESVRLPQGSDDVIDGEILSAERDDLVTKPRNLLRLRPVRGRRAVLGLTQVLTGA